MNTSNKLHFCQECQEMVFHRTDEHEEATTVDYYERKLKDDEKSENFGSGYSLMTLIV